MTREERKALAQQILTNPLTEIILHELEEAAKERAISADLRDDEGRLNAILEVRAARAFRRKLVSSTQDNPATKGAPA